MKVVMVCSGGMSSAIVVQAVLKEAQKNDFDLEMIAVGSGEIEEKIKENFDLVLVAPQVKHQFSRYEELAKENNVPIELIPPMGYTPIGAPKTLEQIKKYKKG